MHPTVKVLSTGEAVKELQQGLNNWLDDPAHGGKPPHKKLKKIDGIFGLKTRAILKSFQRAKGLQANGVCDDATWAEVDQIAGPVTRGKRSFQWTQFVEGMYSGGRARYNWRVQGTTLTITVKINFTGLKDHPMVNTWLQDIRDVWNTFKAVEVGAVGPPREFSIDFNPVKDSSAPHKVRVGAPTPADPNPRSDAANWYVNDQRKGLAPHEFGHLVGLEDEYNRIEEHYAQATGLEPEVGQILSAGGKTPKQVSDELHAVITANATATPLVLMQALAAEVQSLQLEQGGFARAVAQQFEADHGFDGERDISTYFAKLDDYQWTGFLARATAPFLVSGQSIMGEMGPLGGPASRNVDIGALANHEHPVQPRHIRMFAELLTRAVPGTQWKPERR